MLTVLHLKVSRDGQLDRELCLLHSRVMMMGADRKQAVETILRDAPGWDARGLSYVTVAEIEGDDMSAAFEKTNNIDDAWCENPAPGVTVKGNGRHRSTSVGDLIYVDGGARTFFVDSFGFTEICL